MKKFLSLFLTLVMVFSCFSFNVSAATTAEDKTSVSVAESIKAWFSNSLKILARDNNLTATKMNAKINLQNDATNNKSTLDVSVAFTAPGWFNSKRAVGVDNVITIITPDKQTKRYSNSVQLELTKPGDYFISVASSDEKFYTSKTLTANYPQENKYRLTLDFNYTELNKTMSVNFLCYSTNDALNKINDAAHKIGLNNFDSSPFVLTVKSNILTSSLFKNSTNLQRVVFETSSKIAASVFEQCANLKFISSNKNNKNTELLILNIGNYAFRNCKSLSVSLDTNTAFGNVGTESFLNCNSFENKTFITGNTIGERAFKGSNVREIYVIPQEDFVGKTLTIKQSAFENCSNLNRFSVEDTRNIAYHSPADVLRINIGNAAFKNCTNLVFRNDANPETGLLGNIGDEAFLGVRGLALGHDLRILGNRIGKKAFSGTNVDEVYLTPQSDFEGNTITIDDSAFENCSNLIRFSIEDMRGIAYRSTADFLRINIGNAAFKNCTNLVFRNEANPETGLLGNIGDEAFLGIRGLDLSHGLYITGNRIGKKAFSETNVYKVYFIPQPDFEDNTITIDDSAFENCSQLTEVNFKDERGIKVDSVSAAIVLNVGKAAFKNCSKAIVKTNSNYYFGTVGNEAFRYIKGFDKSDIQIIGNKVGNNAFRNTNVKSVHFFLLYNNCNVGSYAFADCSALTNVYVHKLATSSFDIVTQSTSFSNSPNVQIEYKTFSK